jgi:chromosome segregation ATPase
MEAQLGAPRAGSLLWRELSPGPACAGTGKQHLACCCTCLVILLCGLCLSPCMHVTAGWLTGCSLPFSLQAQVQQLSASSQQAAVHAAALAATQAERTQLQHHLQQARAQLSILETQNESLEGELIGFRIRIESSEAHNQRLSVQLAAAQEGSRQAPQLQQQLQQLQEEKAALASEQQAAAACERRLREELAAATAKLAETSGALAELQQGGSADQAKLARARDTVLKLQQEKGRLAGQVEELSEQVARLQQMYDDAVQQLQQQQAGEQAEQPGSADASSAAQRQGLQQELLDARSEAQHAQEELRRKLLGARAELEQAQQAQRDLEQEVEEEAVARKGAQQQLGAAQAQVSELEALVSELRGQVSKLEERAAQGQQQQRRRDVSSPGDSVDAGEGSGISGDGQSKLRRQPSGELSHVVAVLAAAQQRAAGLAKALLRSGPPLPTDDSSGSSSRGAGSQLEALSAGAAKLDALLQSLEAGVSQQQREQAGRQQQAEGQLQQVQAKLASLEKENQQLLSELSHASASLSSRRGTPRELSTDSPSATDRPLLQLPVSAGPSGGSELHSPSAAAAQLVPRSGTAAFRTTAATIRQARRQGEAYDPELGLASTDSDVSSSGDGDATERKLSVDFRPLLSVPAVRSAHPKVRQAAGVMDKLAMSAGKFMTGRPVVRVAVVAYIALVHMMLLFTELTCGSGLATSGHH